MIKHILICTVAISALSTINSAANAQTSSPAKDDAQQDAPIADIVVTALHRDMRLQSAPLSIVALSGDALAKAGATQLQDYFREIPNLNLTEGPLGQSRISIRGVTSIGEATTGLYYDETPITGPSGTVQDPGNNAADLNLFDIERVEVLRGPQGTLYGASSMAGTLRLIFNKPKLDAVEGAAEAQLSSTRGGTMGYYGKAMVNVPIVNDKLAVRVAGYYEKRPGYIDNVRYGTKNINDSDAKGIRALVGFEPDPDTKFVGTAIYQKSSADDQQGWYPQIGKYKTDSAAVLPFDNHFQLYNLTGSHKFGGVTLTATGSYYKYNIIRTIDFTPTVAAVSFSPAACRGYFLQAAACTSSQLAQFNAYGLGSTPAIGYQPAYLKSHNYETRLASNGSGIFQWTVGGYYEKRRDHTDSNITTVSSINGAIPDPLQDLSYRYIDTFVRQVAGFGEASLSPINGLTITGGLRYYDYKKTTAGAAPLASVLTASVVAPYSARTVKDNGWLEKFNINYKFTPDLMVYASAAKGFRPGGANNIPSLQSTLVAYAADSLWNYELGVKSSWLNNKLIINAAIFQVDWKNIQTASRTADGLYTFLTNAGAARIRGGEVEITARPVRGLTLTAAGGYSDAKLTEDQASSALTASGSTGRAGDRLPGSPRWSGSASASYSWAVTDNLNGLLRADYAYTGSITGAFRPTDPYYTTYGKYSTVNLRTGVENDRWGLFLFVQNVGDVVGTTGRLSSFGYSNLTYSIPPRTIGVNVRTRF